MNQVECGLVEYKVEYHWIKLNAGRMWSSRIPVIKVKYWSNAVESNTSELLHKLNTMYDQYYTYNH